MAGTAGEMKLKVILVYRRTMLDDAEKYVENLDKMDGQLLQMIVPDLLRQGLIAVEEESVEEAENTDDEVAREEAMKHLHPVFPEDTELDETLDDESTGELNWLV